MFPAQRIALLKNILLEKKTVDTATLCSQLDVSDVTVRKYLDKLEQEGFLIKYHGGAMLADTFTEEESVPENPDGLQIEHYQEKEQVAKIAADLVEDGENIFIGAGMTCTLFAKHLGTKKNITVVTNNLSAAPYLVPYVKRVYFLGGDLVCGNNCLYTSGTDTLNYLQRIYVSKAFFDVDGIDFAAGLTVNDLNRATLIDRICNLASKRCILADCFKFNRIDLYRVCDLDYFDIYITNPQLEDRYKTYFFDHDIKLLTSYDI